MWRDGVGWSVQMDQQVDPRGGLYHKNIKKAFRGVLLYISKVKVSFTLHGRISHILNFMNIKLG